MHFSLHWLQAAAEARQSAPVHAVTYVDFLTVTLTAMCVLLAALGFIVAILAFVGYREIKNAATNAATEAGKEAARVAGTKVAELAMQLKLLEYPNAGEIHSKYDVLNTYMTELLRKENLVTQLRASSSKMAKTSQRTEVKPRATAARPKRYPGKAE